MEKPHAFVRDDARAASSCRDRDEEGAELERKIFIAAEAEQRRIDIERQYEDEREAAKEAEKERRVQLSLAVPQVGVYGCPANAAIIYNNLATSEVRRVAASHPPPSRHSVIPRRPLYPSALAPRSIACSAISSRVQISSRASRLPSAMSGASHLICARWSLRGCRKCVWCAL